MTQEQKQKTALERLRDYEKKGCHMLVPSAISIEDIASGFALVVDPVLLKSHPKDKDVYAHETSQYDYKANDWKMESRTGKELVRVHKQGFDRLAQAARIEWLSPQIVRDTNVKGRMMAQVEGMIRTSTGEYYRMSDVYGMDLEIERKKLEMQYAKSSSAQYLISRDLLQKEVHQEKLCVSGAKNRVTKQLLCIANTYSVEDIRKEFIAIRIVPRLDMNDEYTRRRLVDMQIAAMASVYGLVPTGQPQPKAIEMVGQVDEKLCIGDDNIVDVDQHPETEPDQRGTDFGNCEVPEQCKILTRLASQKGYGLEAWLVKVKKPLDQVTGEKRLELFTWLNTQPDISAAEDVPFAMGGN